MKRLWRNPFYLIAAGCALIVLVLLAIPFYRIKPNSIQLTIINTGPSTMRAITVTVTGNSYRVKDIPAGNSVSLSIHATGESGLTIDYENDSKKQKKVSGHCYLQKDYVGTIEIRIQNDKIHSVQKQIGPDTSLWRIVKWIVFRV